MPNAKGLGYSQNRRVSGQRLCLLFSQIPVFSVPTPLFLSAEICAKMIVTVY